MESVRVDRWLGAARIFRSRTQAADACSGGHVRVNDGSVKPHHLVRIGDRLSVRRSERQLELEILALGEKRLSPQKARELYEDHSPPPPPREQRPPAAGRPTKRDRQSLRRLRGRS